MQTCIIEIAYGAVAVGPSNRKRPDGLNCTVLEKVFRPVYYRLKCRLSGNLAGENIVVSMTKLSLCYTYTGLTIFPVSCLKSVSQRDTAVSSQKRPKSVLDTDDPYHVACLLQFCCWHPSVAQYSTAFLPISPAGSHLLCDLHLPPSSSILVPTYLQIQ